MRFIVAAYSASNTSSPTTTPVYAPPAGPSLGAPNGRVAKSTWSECHLSCAQLRTVWNAASLAKAETALADLVTAYRETAPKLAKWLEENVPEGLTVFSLPERHRRRLRTSNLIERAIQQELKRRTIKVRVFPNEEALERLVSAVLVQIDDDGPST